MFALWFGGDRNLYTYIDILVWVVCGCGGGGVAWALCQASSVHHVDFIKKPRCVLVGSSVGIVVKSRDPVMASPSDVHANVWVSANNAETHRGKIQSFYSGGR